MFPTDFVSSRGSRIFSTYESPVAAPVFRKSIFLEKFPQKAELIIGATGFYDIFLNGTKITKGHLAPFVSNPDEIVFYDAYDLLPLLSYGENVICVMLGNGFRNPIGGEVWNHHVSPQRSAPSFALEFTSDYPQICFTAKQMLWQDSHILFDDCRLGTFCDMTKYKKELFLGGFDESSMFAPIAVPQPLGIKRFASCEPVKTVREIEPVAITPGELRDYRIRTCFLPLSHKDGVFMPKTPTMGGYIYDFGENVAGTVRLKIKGHCGQVIHMQFTELMFEGFADYINVDAYPDGCSQKDVYIVGSDNEETYIPPFTYHGFRYCYVHGITPDQAQGLLTCLTVHNDVKKRACFECSDEISNLIVAACCRSDLSNMHYIITDCPAREKNGWTGDAAVSAQHFMQFFGAENVFSDWLACIRATQSADGRIHLIVPASEGRSDSPVWDSVLFYLPYYALRYAGNIDIVRDNADAMMQNIRFHLSRRDTRGIVESGFGDWLPVDKGAADYASPLGFCCTAILCDECSKGSEMMRAVGRYDDAEFLETTRKQLISALRAEYNDNGTVIPGRTKQYVKPLYRVCQTSQVLGLYAGIFDETETVTAKNVLLDLIKQNGGAFDCGFLGLRFIFRVLSSLGESDTAYSMITRPAHPSYANMIYRGATSVWERFVAPGGRTGSYNHHFMADVGGWYLEHIAGINVNPECTDPDLVYISPDFICGMDSVKASCKTPCGSVEVMWQRRKTDSAVELFVTRSGNVKIQYDPKLLSDKSKIIIKEKHIRR